MEDFNDSSFKIWSEDGKKELVKKTFSFGSSSGSVYPTLDGASIVVFVCSKCAKRYRIDRCEACSGRYFQSTQGAGFGIACQDCNEGIYNWKCRNCGVANLTEQTFYLLEKKSNCFIATATFENQDAPEIQALRIFRDEVLLISNVGKLFVSCYYKLSPKVATLITTFPKLKALSKKLLTRLVNYLPKHYQNRSD
jgi:hypothetical protein